MGEYKVGEEVKIILSPKGGDYYGTTKTIKGKVITLEERLVVVSGENGRKYRLPKDGSMV